MTNLQLQLAAVKSMLGKINLDDHHQGWRATDLLWQMKYKLDGIVNIVSCPENMTCCAECHEHVDINNSGPICSACGCDLTR